MTVRVLRLLEYVYDDFETMEVDMAHWSIPANGSYARAKGRIIYSAVLPPRTELIAEQERDGNEL